jgi:DNA-binding transcriptional LysR family regulator
MHIKDVDLNLFIVFDAIYSEGGVSRACRRLNLTQPAVSHALGRLRVMFNDPLFVRRRHVMTPTPLARQMIAMVRQSLNGLETTLSQTNRFDPTTTRRRFTIGLRNNLETPFLNSLLTRITDVAPLVDISTVRPERRDLERELSAGVLDAAIDTLLPLSRDIRRERILTERLVVLARRNHPHIGTKLDAKTYLKMEHICVTSRRHGPSYEDFEFQRLGIERNVRLQCQTQVAACAVVSQSNLLLTTSELIASALNDPLSNRVFPCPFSIGPHENYLYWHTTTDEDPANRWLREQLVAIGRTLDQNETIKPAPRARVSSRR